MIFLILALVLKAGLVPQKALAKRKKTFVLEMNQINWPIGWSLGVSGDLHLGALGLTQKGWNLHSEFFLYIEPSLVGLQPTLSNESNNLTTIRGIGGSLGIRKFFGKTGMDGFFYGVKSSVFVFKSETNKDTTGKFWIGFFLEGGYRLILFKNLTLGTSLSFGPVFFKSKVQHLPPFLPWGDLRLSVGVAF